MIEGLAQCADEAQVAMSIGGGVDGDVEEKVAVNVVRAAEGRQITARSQELEGTQMDFFVTANGGIHGVTSASEGGRIQDDYVER